VNGVTPQVSPVAAPASAVGVSLTLTNFVSTASLQLLLLTVIVKVTVVPASAATGMYVGDNVVALISAPDPFSVHTIVPFANVASVTVYALVSQVSAVAAPASAVGTAFTVKAFVSIASAHVPLAVVTVIINVTIVPASAAPGV
jgi:hypothetical protein